jgi:micrococcal nuclease
VSADQLWTYRARLVRVIDGDTAVFLLDLGFRLTFEAHCRFAGINCPEIATDAGKAARTFTQQWLAGTDGAGWPLTVTSNRLDDYGRPIGTIIRNRDGRELNQDLLDSGNAVVYPAPKVP